MSNFDRPEVSGKIFGMDIIERPAMMIGGKLTPIAPLITLCVEDDEAWHRKEQFDAGWLDDLIRVAQAAKLVINKE